jgi:hypothetical protein
MIKKIMIFSGSLSLVGVFVALFSPKNILENLPLIQPWIDIMTFYLPSVAERIAASKIPQVLALTYLVGWTLFPLQFILFCYCAFNYPDLAKGLKSLQTQGHSKTKILLTYYSATLLGFYYQLFIGNSDFHYLGIDPINSRIGLALVGGLGFLLNSFSLAISLRLTFTKKYDWNY